MTDQPMNFESLKSRQREIRDQFPNNLGLRVHRAISWSGRAEQESGDGDACFMFLWIAFNAAYANELHDRAQFTEKGVFRNFINRMVDLDHEKLLSNTVWNGFTQSIRLLIDNRYIFQPFWDFQNGKITEDQWKDAFAQSKKRAYKAVGDMNTEKVLMVIFERLYTLRNQLIHGGATWNSQVNRDQIRDGAEIMGKLIPAIITIMMDHPEALWGEPCYPVVD